MQMSIYDLLYEDFKINKPIRLIETFGGIGSQAAALRNIGVDFESYRYIEIDKYAVSSYNAIFNTDYQPTDIRNVHADELGIGDKDDYTYLLTYSFPCQDLSVAGKGKGMKKGSGTRSGLLWEIERILDECTELPQVLLMENVPQVIAEKNINDFNEWRNKLESLGYKNYVSLLNSKDFDVPQNRNRCFMVSIFGNYNYTFPKGKKLKYRLKDILEDDVDEKYYVSEETVRKFVERNDQILIVKNNNSKGYDIATVGDTINLSFPNSKTRRGRIGHQIAQTLDTGCEQGVVVWNEGVCIRKLTPRECWRLMGFRDEDFDKARYINSDTQLYKQAGNSIVVNVLEGIFGKMM